MMKTKTTKALFSKNIVIIGENGLDTTEFADSLMNLNGEYRTCINSKIDMGGKNYRHFYSDYSDKIIAVTGEDMFMNELMINTINLCIYLVQSLDYVDEKRLALINDVRTDALIIVTNQELELNSQLNSDLYNKFHVKLVSKPEREELY